MKILAASLFSAVMLAAPVAGAAPAATAPGHRAVPYVMESETVVDRSPVADAAAAEVRAADRAEHEARLALEAARASWRVDRDLLRADRRVERAEWARWQAAVRADDIHTAGKLAERHWAALQAERVGAARLRADRREVIWDRARLDQAQARTRTARAEAARVMDADLAALELF
ncbi:MAG: hypothetical protein H6709_00380 [Kofleriaceae bacterium]|nr:hypothetical protein [Kofleriaceae bacterium]